VAAPHAEGRKRDGQRVSRFGTIPIISINTLSEKESKHERGGTNNSSDKDKTVGTGSDSREKNFNKD